MSGCSVMNGKDLELGVRRSAVCGLRSAVCRREAGGFTLIELLVSMGILMIIVLMLANLFQQSTRAYDVGMRNTDIGLEARAIMNLIQRELSMALPEGGFDDGSGASFAILDRDGVLTPVMRSAAGQNQVDDFQVARVDIEPTASTDFPDLVEVRVTITDTRRAGSGVRVHVADRGWNEAEQETDVIDTHRSRDP